MIGKKSCRFGRGNIVLLVNQTVFTGVTVRRARVQESGSVFGSSLSGLENSAIGFRLISNILARERHRPESLWLAAEIGHERNGQVEPIQEIAPIGFVRRGTEILFSGSRSYSRPPRRVLHVSVSRNQLSGQNSIV